MLAAFAKISSNIETRCISDAETRKRYTGINIDIKFEACDSSKPTVPGFRISKLLILDKVPTCNALSYDHDFGAVLEDIRASSKTPQ